MAGKDRLVRVVAVTQENLRPKDPEYVEQTLERLEMAAGFRPDVACLPEVFPRRDPETVPGPITDRVGRWAREHSCWVVCPLKAKVGDLTFNSAVVLDRQGAIAGRYDKIHLTEGELEAGICPGAADPPVFRTDFGVVGIQICFDVNWRDTWRRLKEKGAEIVFFPAAFPAARQLGALAWMNEFFVVSSTTSRPARIYDVTGEVTASSGMFRPWAQATVRPGKRIYEIDYHVKKMREIESKYGPRVNVAWCHDEDWVTLETLDPGLSAEDLANEYGLVPKREYLARCEPKIDDARGRLLG